jgi:UDP-galactopyranose mutase
MKYDYLIVGSGFFGSICARELTDAGFKCLVLEKRNHIGGNCYSENKDGINLHVYGPHIFHTSNEEVWSWINKYVKFNNFTLRSVANYNGEIYSLPFNMLTFSKMWSITLPQEAKEIIARQSSIIKSEPKNLEEQAIKLVGIDVYEKLIKGYTEKQWKKSCDELPASIIKRIPVRYTYDNNYFNDKYQGIPIGGYTQIFDKLLDGVEIKLNVDYLTDKDSWNSLANKIIYTGPIDAYYDYQFGKLEYKTTKFEHQKIDTENYQGIPIMNFTSKHVPYTRIVEHKHFENVETPCTWITHEYPIEYVAGKNEPYYPVNDEVNNNIYNNYKNFTKLEKKVIFGGRLGEYKYYDMDKIIESALRLIKKEIE